MEYKSEITVSEMNIAIHEFIGGVFRAYNGNSSYKRSFAIDAHKKLKWMYKEGWDDAD